MKLQIKSKLSLGITFLFVVIMLTGIVGLFAINKLANESKNILTANYESMIYAKNMQRDLDNFYTGKQEYLNDFEKNLEAQERNITEPGEQETTGSLRDLFEKYRKTDTSLSLIPFIRNQLYLVNELNMNAIVKKSTTTQRTAYKSKLYLEILVTICFLLSFSFLLNFPGYIANPIRELTAAIKQIANRNYSQRIHIDKGDEFGELAEAFNSMAKQLDEYENSNLAKIIFEKKRIETIINGMKDPIIGLDENRNILFVNATAIKILGIKETDLIGKYAPDIALKNDLLRNLINDTGNNTP